MRFLSEIVIGMYVMMRGLLCAIALALLSSCALGIEYPRIPNKELFHLDGRYDFSCGMFEGYDYAEKGDAPVYWRLYYLNKSKHPLLIRREFVLNGKPAKEFWLDKNTDGKIDHYEKDVHPDENAFFKKFPTPCDVVGAGT